MGLDVDKFQGIANQTIQEKQTQQSQPEPSLWDKAKATGENVLTTVENAAESAGTFIENTASNVNDAYHNMLNAQLEITGAYTNEAVNTANTSGDYSQQNQAVSDLQSAGQQLVYSPFKEASRDIINNYADDNNSSLQDLAQNLRRSTANVDYYMTDDEKLAKAIDIQNVTGIDAQSILNDTNAYKKALEIYDYANKKKALGGSMEDVWNEFPGLKDVAQMDPQSAALALHDINSVRQTKTVIDSFTKMLEYGNLQLEYKNLNYKLMNGTATDDDKTRIADLSKQLEDEPVLPSFLDNPLAYIAAGVAGSAPEMVQSFGQMATDFAEGAIVGAVAGAAVGGVGAVPGAIGTGLTNAARAYAMREAAISGARLMSGYAARYGMFEGMYKPETGGYFAQYKDMKDENGKPLLSDDAAKEYAKVAGALNSGIEMANFEVVKNALVGSVYKDTVKEIVSRAQSQAAASEAIKDFLKNRAASIYEVTASETLEEGLQSVSDDLVHNQIEIDTGDKSNQVFTAKDIAAHAVSSMGQALPGAVGYGLMSSFGGGISESTGLSRSIKHTLDDNARFDMNARKTFSGAMMLEQLQQTVNDSKLKNTAPAVQEKLIRQQLQGTGFEMAYVDTETALRKESGRQDLENLANAAGYSKEDLQTAIDTKGTLAVPVEKFAQAETSSNILQSVSFDNASEPLAKINDNAKEITKQMNEKIQRSVNNQMKMTDAVLNELFPENMSSQEERDTAQAAIYTNPENPQAGWNSLYKQALAEKTDIISPALTALKNGMGNGVDIVQSEPGADGGIRVSKNAKWYQEFYKQNKRAPTNAELEDMASDLMTGKPTAPQVENWIPATADEQKSLQENEQALSAIDAHIQNLQSIKDKMNQLNGVEMRLTQGLTPEGYSVYRQLAGQLQRAGGKTARAARMDAILFARHADIVSQIMSDKDSKAYTAIDYYKDRFGLDTEGKIKSDFSNTNTAEKGSITKMTNGQRIISLYETADESTFVHEMSHMFLMDLDDLAKIDGTSQKELAVVNEWANWKNDAANEYRNTPWQGEFAAREKSIMAAHDAGDIKTETSLKEQWRQERFARAFETYLKSGKTPAKGLKAVFRKFKKFLRDIYIGFTSTGGTASSKVEAVMSRMIATEDEINEAALDDRFKDVTKAGGEKLFNETQDQTYKRWHDEALAEAKEKLMAIVMQDLQDEKQRKFAQRVEAEHSRKQSELENQNIYIAKNAADQAHNENIVLNWYPSIEAYHEELEKTPSLEKALNDYMDKYSKQLDQDMMNSNITDERIAEAMESTPYHRKLIALENQAFAEKEKLINRIDSKAKMAMQDVADKISALPDNIDLKVDKDDDSVKAVMQAINKLRFASKWTAKDFSRITSMIKSSTKEQVQEALNDFKQKAQQENINRQAIEKAAEGKLQLYKEMAQKSLLGRPICQAADYTGYRKQEKIHARHVQQALKGRNWDTAMHEKEAQYVSAALAEQAKKTQEHIMGLVKKVDQQLKTRSIKLPAQEKYWHKHLAYILRLTKEDAAEPVDGIVPLEDMFNSLKDSLDLEYMPSDILTIAQKKDFAGYQSLSVGEFEDAVQALTILYTTGRDKFKLKTIGGKDIKDIIDEILTDNTGYNGLKVNRKNANPDTGGLGYNGVIAKTPLIGQVLARGGAKYLATMMKPEEMIKMLGEKAHKYLYGTYERASRKEAQLTAENVYKIQDMLSAYSHKEKLAWKKKQYQFLNDKDDLYTKEQVICMALNLGNEINTSRLVMGLGKDSLVSENDVRDFINAHMTKKDWQLVQNIWDHLHSFWADTVKVEQQLNGITLKPQEPKPFDVTFSDGEVLHMKGGYYPIAADPEKNVHAEDKSIDEAVRRQMSGAQVLGTGRGFVKARSEHDLSRMLKLEFNVIPEHIGNVIHNITYRLAARDVFRLVNDSRFAEQVQGTLGNDAYKVIRSWSTDVWKTLPDNSNQAATFLERTFSSLRRNSTMAIMGYRLYPVLENFTNIFPIMDKIGTAKALSAVSDFYANRREYTDLLHKSVFMRNRINNMDRDIKSIPGLFNEDRLVSGWLKEHAYSMMMYSDLMFSAPLWCHSYKEAFQGKLEKVIAENEANKKEFANAQAGLSTIRAKMIDLNNDKHSIGDELENRRFMVQPEQLDQKWAGLRDDELRAQSVNNGAELEDLKKQLFQAEIRLDNASDLQILDNKEILKEAEQRSIEAADGAVRQVFGSGEVKDQASIQKGPEFTKLFTAFFSFFNTQANAILGAYYKGMYDPNRGRITRWMPAAKAVLYRIVLASAMSTMMRMALLGDGSDDKDKYRKEKDADGNEKKVEIPLLERFLNQFGKNTLSTAAGTLWGIRDIANFYINEAFDGTDYGRGISIAGTATQAGLKMEALFKLITAKSDRDLKIADQEAKEAASYQKMTKKQRREYDQNKQYKQPVKRITYTDIAKAAGGFITSVSAAKTGITDTMANTVLTTMQYMNDTDGRYDPTLKNIIWSALFDKKPAAREIPQKPEKPKKKGRRNDK